MYKLLSFIFVFSVSTTVYAKVTDADVDRDMRNLAAQNHFVTQGDIDNQWNWYNKPPNESNSTDWELRVWTSITRGGCCGYVTRTWFGKFDRKTGKFLGYINQQTETDSINGPGSHWK
ncbi:hypothetical protein ACPV3S_17260 [Photobacterium damselae]|uniref:hypothetical protein n=1 Tax=Photobacterium damselae TaxID=38293 RepID=UPI004067FBC2